MNSIERVKVTWSKLDHGFPDHPKVMALSDFSFRIHIKAMCYAGRYLTDGFIPDGVYREWEKKRGARRIYPTDELVSAGLWDEEEGGFRIHDYLEHQSSKEEVEAEKQRNRDRVKAHREKSNKPENYLAESGLDEVTKAEVIKLANQLADWMVKNKLDRPTITKTWLKDIERMIAIDGKSVEQISKAIDYAQSSAFWCTNILSPRKLREKYSVLQAQAIKGNPKVHDEVVVFREAAGLKREQIKREQEEAARELEERKSRSVSVADLSGDTKEQLEKLRKRGVKNG